MTWGIVGDLIMSIMESHSPGASLLVVVSFVSVISCDVVIARLVANYRAWSALPSDAMTKGVPEITTKPLCMSHNSRSVHIDGDESFMKSTIADQSVVIPITYAHGIRKQALQIERRFIEIYSKSQNSTKKPRLQS
ncbi:hypothetical protein Sjap_000579 [Stephania japonica]|uniref:Uncharacterized protein n=1 Tax=Stephania japonica TaxID=461633 RepID=A0AAP0PSM2_9MAGN